MSAFVRNLLILSAGAVVGVLIAQIFAEQGEGTSNAEKKPLYWVAPMDSNYRRDKPGKSPMGMDLVPVYEETQSSEDSAGVVTISPEMVNNMGVRVATVKQQVMSRSISTVGYVQYDEDYLVHIHPRVSGWVDRLYVKAEGDPVEQGQPLYTLYSPQLVNAQEEFLIALKRNNKSLIQAAKDRLAALQLSNQFIQSLQRDKQIKQNVTFYARQSGVINGLKIREGFYVEPGNTIMSIAQLEHVWVEALVLERDAGLVARGQPVTMRLDYQPGQVWQGVVDYIYPSLDAKTRSLRVRLKFANQDGRLKANMFAQISIKSSNHEYVLTVPQQAVIRTGNQSRVVVVLGGGRFKSVRVETGRFAEEAVQILSGVEEGDRVVVSAQFLIDSESSKTADFSRMEYTESDHQMAMEMAPESARVNGVINHIDVAGRVLNISRDGIEKWGRGPATMDFAVVDDIDLSELKSGMSVNFRFVVDDDLTIVSLKPLEEAL